MNLCGSLCLQCYKIHDHQFIECAASYHEARYKPVPLYGDVPGEVRRCDG